MRYFFTIYLLVIVLVVSFFGFRGQKFTKPPIRIFPDMDTMDFIKTQSASDFFANGMGSRKPVAGTIPRGFEPDGTGSVLGTNAEAYFYSGKIGEKYGDGIPDEMGLKASSAQGFLRQGRERYNISCAPCHGTSGDGKGTVALLGIPTVSDIATFKKPVYPDGKMFEVISKGKGLMGGYGHNISVRDRWAIIAYVRVLQQARKKTKE